MKSKQTQGMISREKRTEKTQRLTEPEGVQNLLLIKLQGQHFDCTKVMVFLNSDAPLGWSD